jgi:hypothetical protein
METISSHPHLVHFGAFAADLQAGELRKDGVKVRLQYQPFQFLAILLECPGELVTREELRKRLWVAGTFVDFDHPAQHSQAESIPMPSCGKVGVNLERSHEDPLSGSPVPVERKNGESIWG